MSKTTRRDHLAVAGSTDDPNDVLPILWTSREVAEALKVTPSTLCRWRATGKGPRVYWLSPDSPRYRRSDVLAWLEEVAA
ncbi:helix-turn-helix domain-containing protein [Nocardioides sp. NPDC023903]|uniref:helix-turn-helix transcriptional regulator n=1 Tax=Nocardioides sp. NPDC023903 TaxID=3157195 RepID=UPI0033D7C6B8